MAMLNSIKNLLLKSIGYFISFIWGYFFFSAGYFAFNKIEYTEKFNFNKKILFLSPIGVF